MLCPFMLGNEVMLNRLSEEQKAKKMGETGQQISEWLAKHT